MSDETARETTHLINTLAHAFNVPREEIRKLTVREIRELEDSDPVEALRIQSNILLNAMPWHQRWTVKGLMLMTQALVWLAEMTTRFLMVFRR